LPGIDGIELARKIGETSSIPIILYTGRGGEEVAEEEPRRMVVLFSIPRMLTGFL